MKKISTKTISAVLVLTMLGFSPLSHAEDVANSNDDDILDLVMPAILAARTTRIAAKMIFSIDEKKQNTTVKCFPGKCSAPKKYKGESILAPPNGYKFCATKIDYVSGSKNANVNVYFPDNSGNVTIKYDVPCSGGGVSTGQWNQLVGVVTAAVVGYFSGPQYSAGVYDIIAGTATVGGFIGGQIVATATTTVLDGSYRQEGACNAGGKGNWLNAKVNLFMIHEGNDCPIPDKGWRFI